MRSFTASRSSLSSVTVAAMRRYLWLLLDAIPDEGTAPVSASVVRIVERVTEILAGMPAVNDDAGRLALMTALGEAGEEHRTAVYEGDLGDLIPMPLSTAKPFFTAVALMTMFSGLPFLRHDMFAVAMTITIGGACMFIGGLYAWLTSPLE